MKSEYSKRIFNTWRNIQQVVNNPNDICYRRSQAAGLDLRCEFVSFREFENYVLKRLGPPPSTTSRIIRKDQNGDFAPGNLMWGSHQDQGNRYRGNINIKYRNKTRTVSEWSKIMGINYHTLIGRVKRGWDTRDLFIAPLI